MDLAHAQADRVKVEEFLQRHRIGLVTLLFTDLIGSTRLKQTLGDVPAIMRIKEHHAALREVLQTFKEAEEISTAGDSFFVVFARPSDAVKLSLLLQLRLRTLAQETGVPLLDRIGIHVGEVVFDEQKAGGRDKDLYGTQVDACHRLMSLAQGDQIFMSRMVFDNARQILRGQELPGVGPLSWLSHGPYVFKGVEDPLELCEVGEEGKAGLAQPADTDKAHRHVSPDSEPVLGWRPALGQTVPNSRWVLEEKLGQGGFGEVWLARHETLKDRRVLKFCFRADRVRSLKREATIFKLLRDRVGPHPGIVTVHDLFLDKPPFYLVMDYVPGRDLRTWAAQQGGLKQVPLATRLEIAIQVADALQAAHECGIIHRDVKPSNILVMSARSAGVLTRSSSESDEKPETSSSPIPSNVAAGEDTRAPRTQPSTLSSQLTAKLTDFGIGQVTTEEALAGMTKLGFTQTLMSPSSSGMAGTQTYMAPEVLAGKPATTRSDIYSLGVLLFQMTLGEWDRPVTVDWARDVNRPAPARRPGPLLCRRPGGTLCGSGRTGEATALPRRTPGGAPTGRSGESGPRAGGLSARRHSSLGFGGRGNRIGAGTGVVGLAPIQAGGAGTRSCGRPFGAHGNPKGGRAFCRRQGRSGRGLPGSGFAPAARQPDRG